MNLSSQANRSEISAIAMDKSFYINIAEIKRKENENFDLWIKKHKTNPHFGSVDDVDFYHCNIIRLQFKNWVDRGMPNE